MLIKYGEIELGVITNQIIEKKVYAHYRPVYDLERQVYGSWEVTVVIEGDQYENIETPELGFTGQTSQESLLNIISIIENL